MKKNRVNKTGKESMSATVSSDSFISFFLKQFSLLSGIGLLTYALFLMVSSFQTNPSQSLPIEQTLKKTSTSQDPVSPHLQVLGETNPPQPSLTLRGPAQLAGRAGGLELKSILSSCHNCIQGKHIQNSAIDSKEIENKSILSSDIQTGQINSRLIKDFSIQSEDLATELNLNTLTLDRLSIGTSSPSHFDLSSGDVYITRNLEIDGNAYFDQTLYVRDSSSISTMTSNTLQTTTANISNILSNSHLQIKGRLPNEDYLQMDDFLKVFINPSTGTYIGADYTNIPSFSHIDGTEDLYIQDDLEVNGIIYGTISGAFSPSGNLDMGNNLILNIGNSATDFTSTGGLNLGGDLNVNDQFYVNTTSGNVGIGTTAPDSKLSVRGTATQLKLAYDDSNYQTLTVGSNGNLSIARNGAAATLALTDVGVGIGTTSPGQGLHVYGKRTLLEIDNNNILDIYRSSSTVGTGADINFSFNNASGTKNTGASILSGIVANTDGAESAYISFFTRNAGTNAERFRITNAGNVGIGTTSPGEKLDVLGSIKQDGGTYTTTLSGGSTITGSNHLILESVNSYLRLSSVAGQMYFRSGAGHRFQNGDGTSDFVSITTTGNVGIGTTGPGQLLEVNKSQDGDTAVLVSNTNTGVSARSQLKLTSSGGSGYLSMTGGSYTGVTDWQDSLVLSADSVVDGGIVLYSPDKVRIQTAGAGTDALTVISTGNVGIGTTGPAVKLDIRTSSSNSLQELLRLTNPDVTDSGGSAVAISFSVDNPKGMLAYERKASYGRGDFHFLQNTATNSTGAGLSDAVMTIKNNGNVGIGTTGPSTKLHIVSTSDTDLVTIADSDGTCTLNPESGGAWSCTSDEKLKNTIASLDLGNSLSKITGLRPVSFRMNRGGDINYGFIAQEVASVIPEAVSAFADGTLGLAEGKFTPYIVGAIQELNVKKADLNLIVTNQAAVDQNFVLLGGRITDLEEWIPDFVEMSTDIEEKADLSQLELVEAELTADLLALENTLTSRVQALESTVAGLESQLVLPEEFSALRQALIEAKIEFDAQGNLKVKKLETEKVKFKEAEEVPLCDEASEGEFYYDKTEKSFLGCDGVSWKKMQFSSEETPETP